MRTIERKMLQAVNNKRNFSLSNTSVIVLDGIILVTLHGNCIATIDKQNPRMRRFSLCGWNTPTTRSRLNALGCGVYQRNFTPYRNGQEWWKDDTFVDVATI